MQEISIDPRAIEREQAEKAREEKRLNCMRRCFDSLPPDRKLLLMVYVNVTDEQRLQIARRLNITPGNLALRVHRMREKLALCRKNCLENLPV